MDDLLWAARTLLRVAKLVRRYPLDRELMRYSWGADRSAARGLPGLLLPQAAEIRSTLGLDSKNEPDSADDALVVARALLTVASGGNDSLLQQHLTALSDHAPAMAGSLEAIAVAAEENPAMGATARRLWPVVMNHVLDHIETGHLLDSQSRHGPQTLTALLPAAAYDAGYLRREIDEQPHPWTTPLEWKPEIERWLPHAAGQANCVDALIRALTGTLEAEQAASGLPWVESLITANHAAAAHQSLLLPQWLRDIRGNVHGELMTCWQRIVDALIVTGDSRVSDLAD